MLNITVVSICNVWTLEGNNLGKMSHHLIQPRFSSPDLELICRSKQAQVPSVKSAWCVDNAHLGGSLPFLQTRPTLNCIPQLCLKLNKRLPSQTSIADHECCYFKSLDRLVFYPNRRREGDRRWRMASGLVVPYYCPR